MEVKYREKGTFGGLKGQSLKTGGLKDRFDCTYRRNELDVPRFEF